MERSEILEKVLSHYSVWYDVTRAGESEAPLAATAAFHEHDTGYALVRKAEMWSADRHEYVWFFSVPHLDRPTWDACFQRSTSEGEALVKPEEGHMSTNLVTVFLCDSIDDDVAEVIRNCRIRKSFMFSLKGWMEVHVAAVDTGRETVVANRAAQATRRFLDSIFHPVTRKKNPLSMLKEILG